MKDRKNAALMLQHRGYSSMALITVSPTAKILEIAEVTVRAQADRGELPFILTEGGIRLFERAVIEAIAKERKARRAALRGEQA